MAQRILVLDDEKGNKVETWIHGEEGVALVFSYHNGTEIFIELDTKAARKLTRAINKTAKAADKYVENYN